MASFWFVSAPLAGHLDWGGLLKTAQAVQAAGHDVVWVSQPPIAPLVSAAGIAFAPIAETGWLWPPPPMPDPHTLKPAEAVFLRYRRALDTWLSEDLIPPAVEALIALAQERGTPAALVTDPFLTAAAFAAEALDVPLIVGGWPAGQPLDADRLLAVQAELGRISRERLHRMQTRLGLRGINFSTGATPSVQSPHLHISYFSRTWHQADPDFLPQTHFVGGTITPPQPPAPDWLTAIPTDVPLALITLGSAFTGDLGFFSWAAQAAARLDLLPIVVLGRNPIAPEQKAALKAALPPHTRLLNWIDYDHVFPRLKVIIHHGGMGTTHRAIVQGIPQVVVPHAADQRGQARRAAQAKVGLNLTAHDVAQGQLMPAIRAVTTDPKVLANAAALAAMFAGLGGPTRAAQLMIRVAEQHLPDEQV
ncbi:MAG: glycosyltransferase family 1 protein [Anaerolineae bacterium]|nr:glycosyltransferase family 1 protein [Anaerolineae bacterium]